MANDRSSLVEISRLYYEQGLTQTEIAEMLGQSRPIISRKLSEARELGIVKIYISDAEEDTAGMERRLRAALGLRGVKVASVPNGNAELAVEITARLGAQYLSTFIEGGDRIGMAWGWTLNMMAGFFQPFEGEIDAIVQCTGNMDDVKSSSTSDGMIKDLSAKFHAHKAHTLPCPPMVESPIIANTLLYDKKLNQVLDCVRSCNKLFINIALADESTCLYKLGYLSEADLQKLRASGAVGSICCRFFDANGNACDPEIDARTLGIGLEDIKKAECVMGCIVGANKARAICCAAKTGILDVLVTDSVTAARMLELIDSGELQK